ncbi:MAG: lamin tail domain-containing protein [Nannocystaceae bacterium]|nr:lamin tail domain-containing protein [bacterium]
MGAGDTDDSTGADTTGGETVDPTNVTTNVTTTTDTTGDTDESTTSVDPDTGSTTDDPTEGTTSGSTTDAESSSSGDESSSSTGTPETCGNGVLDMDEECDALDLDGATCDSLGFAGGTLACAADCTYDTSGCETCGNGVLDEGEDCEGDDLGGATCASIDMGFTGGALACDATCGFDTSGCTSLDQPAMGQVIISEIMPNPSVVADGDGEWFELHNPSETDTYQLGGCEIAGNEGEDVIPLPDLPIPPGAYLTFAPSSMEDVGFVPDYEWEVNYFLSNGGDVVTLVCDGMTIDSVDYDAFAFSAGNGLSLNLDPGSFDATANDDGDNWCDAQTEYNSNDTNTDLGTPGAANDLCPQPVVVDFCRLQFPNVINEDAGATLPVYGRVFEAGITDVSAGNDPAPGFGGQLGYGPDGTDPAVDGGWTWIDAVPNPGWDGTAAGEPNNDEYQVDFTVPAPGEYDYAFRFTADDGLSYLYCDGLDAGSSDGYQIENAGQMTSNGTGGVFELYFSEYVEGSGNNKAVEIYNSGANDVDLSACQLQQYNNGDDTVSFSLDLAGTLVAGDAFVVCRSSGDAELQAVCDLSTGNSAVNFNGDDSVALSCDGVLLDIMGTIGLDPGSYWPDPDINPDPSVDTQNETLRRNCDSVPDTDGTDNYDPGTDWTSFPQDTFDDLGQYICD